MFLISLLLFLLSMLISHKFLIFIFIFILIIVITYI